MSMDLYIHMLRSACVDPFSIYMYTSPIMPQNPLIPLFMATQLTAGMNAQLFLEVGIDILTIYRVHTNTWHTCMCSGTLKVYTNCTVTHLLEYCHALERQVKEKEDE